jgi:hypothetical protein
MGSERTGQPHLDGDELKELVAELIPMVNRYGTLGLDEAVAEIKRQLVEEECEWLAC